MTYQDFAAAWPARDGALADRINAMRKYVASTTLGDPGWSNAEVLNDAIPEVRRLKEAGHWDLRHLRQRAPCARPHGGGPRGRIQASIAPIVVGKGAQVFEPGTRQTTLRLTDSRTFATGLVVRTYVVER